MASNSIKKEIPKKEIPKYVQRMLDRRRKLAWALMNACADVDDYCKKIGIDFDDKDDPCLLSNVMIYAEPDTAYVVTAQAILKALNRKIR